MGVHLSHSSSLRTSLLLRLCFTAILGVLTLAETNAEEDIETVRGSVALVDLEELFTEPETLPIDTSSCTQLARFASRKGVSLLCVDRTAPDTIRFFPIGNHEPPTPPLNLGSRLAHLAAGDLDGDGSDDIVAITHDNRKSLLLVRGKHEMKAIDRLPLPESIAALPDLFTARVEYCDQIRRFVTFGYREIDGAIRYNDLALSLTSDQLGTTHFLAPQSIAEFRIPGLHRPELRSFIDLPSVCRGTVAPDPLLINVTRRVADRPLLQQINAPEGFAWEFTIHGDFNGDGAVDILSYAGSIGRWWFTSFASASPIPRPLPSLRALPRGNGSLLVGDFNADGRSDVLEQKGHTVAISFARSHPLPEVEIAVNGTRVSKSDEQGRFEFLPPARPFRLAASLRRQNGTAVTEERLVDGELVLPNFVFTKAHLNDSTRGTFVQEGPPLPGPYVCFGVVANRLTEDTAEQLCPPGHYIAALDDSSRSETGVNLPTPRGTCCPLPAPEWLSGEELSTLGECPADSIVIGYQRHFTSPAYPITLRCAKLNTAKAKTGPGSSGIYFGPRTGDRAVSISSAPIGLRAALGRVGLRSWDIDGCTGTPWGAPLTAVTGRRCEQLTFRELLSTEGKALAMFPECISAGSRFDPTDGCR